MNSVALKQLKQTKISCIPLSVAHIVSMPGIAITTRVYSFGSLRFVFVMRGNLITFSLVHLDCSSLAMAGISFPSSQ